MAIVWILISILGLLLLKVQFSGKKLRKRKYPPGPMKLPFFGNLFHLTSSPFPFIAMHNLSLKYGNIMSLKMGTLDTIVLSSSDIMKDLLARVELVNRDWTDFLSERNFGKFLGIAWNRDDGWKQVRKFTVTTLKKFGFDKLGPMESIIQTEVEHTIKKLQEEMKGNNGVVSVNELFMTAPMNIIHRLVTGERLNDDDPGLHQLVHLNDQWFKSSNFVTLAFPFVRDIFPSLSGKNIQVYYVDQLHKYFRNLIKKHDHFNEEQIVSPRNFLEVLINKREEEKGFANPYYTDEQIIVILMDLFQAGSETIVTALNWALLHLILNPNVQEKIHEEIDRVIPKDVKPDLSHKDKMVYIWAFIYESMRFNVTLPIAPLRMIAQDFVYKGLYFKKGTSVIANVHSAFRNKDLWEDPDTFRPERYLNSNGSLNDKSIQNTPVFGFGNRVCLGDKLAMNEMFLFLVSLLKHMTFKTFDGQPAPTLGIQLGLTAQTLPYNMFVQMRKHE